MHVLQITEYGDAQPLAARLAEKVGLTSAQAEAAIDAAGERLRRQHKLRQNPLSTNGGLTRAEDVAGVVSLHPSVDLQIIPKYACNGVSWASDLLFLSLFTTFGRLDALQSIAAGTGEENALAELAARVLLDLVSRNARSPLRIRRRVTFTSFEPDEDIDPDDMLVPEDEGWTQTGYKLTFDNEYASTLSSACRVLLPHVRRLETRAMLIAQMARFGPQTHEPLRTMHRLPSRLARWQSALDLALAILGGNSLSPQSGSFSTLGSGPIDVSVAI